MRKEPLNFSIFEITQDSGYPKSQDLYDLIATEEVYDNGDGQTYLLTRDIRNNILWICFEYGASHPRPEYVYDKDDNNKVTNPRGKNQVEPNKQLFCAYIENTGSLYCSDSKKKMFLEIFLNSLKPVSQIFIKRVIIEPEDFLNQLSVLDKMVIAGKTDLLSSTGHLFQPMQDIFGFGSPEQFYISASYGMKIEDRIKATFWSFHEQTKKGTLKKFVCVGKNDDGLETVFNAEQITKKVVVRLEKNDNGMFQPDDVKEELLNRLDSLMKGD